MILEYEIARFISRSESTNDAALYMIVEDSDDKEVLTNIAKNPIASEKTLKKLIEKSDWEVRVLVSHRTDLTNCIITDLLEDDDCRVVENCASHQMLDDSHKVFLRLKFS